LREGAIFSRNWGHPVVDEQGMTMPRQIVPGRTYLVTRRCTQRQFLLVPDEETEQVFEYCLAEAAARFEIDTITWIAMSDHYHAVVHDEHGQLPEFLAHFHKMVAQVLNARWERKENFWSSDPCSVVHLVDDEDVFERVLYALCNPKNAGAAESAASWRGASSFKRLDQAAVRVCRPLRFFRRKGRSRMPAEVTLRAVAPPAWRGREKEWFAMVRGALRRREQRICAAGGRRRAPQARGSLAPRRATSRERARDLNPRIACRNTARRRQAVQELRAFYKSYRACIDRHLAGDRNVQFPTGTYKHRQFCAAGGKPPEEPRVTAS
jgi:putative transposase